MINFAEFHFIRPYWFLSLIPAIVLLVLILKNKLNQGNWSQVCDAELLPFILQQKATQNTHWVLTAGAFSSLLVIIALAGPTWERLPSPVFRNDAALVIALDLSLSMNATDIKPSRLSKARFKIDDILKQRKDGQTALLVYAGDVFIVTPLTEDTKTIASQLSALKTEIMPSQGSNTVLALEKAVELLKQSGLQTGEILLVTDGINFERTINTVESLAAYRLSILGVGTEQGAPIKLANGAFLKDKQGTIVIPKLNSNDLSRIAKIGNGYYKVISNDDSDIDTLISQFDQPVEKENKENTNLFIDQWNEKGPWLLLLVLPLAALQFRKGLLTLSFLLLLPFSEPGHALEWKDLWQTQNQQAQHSYQQKNYQQAADQFNSPQWKAAAQYKADQYQQASETLKDDQSATGLYNKGNALAKAGNLQKAIKAYQYSLQKNPADEDAKYNLEQVKKALKEQKKKQQKGEGEKDQQSEQEDSESDEQGENSEQNDEKNSSEQDSDSDQSEEQQSNEDESKQAKESEQSEEEAEADETESQQASEPSEYDESEQANEQWLNRIPDDPAGLLKRKFKYQYSQRKHKNTNSESW